MKTIETMARAAASRVEGSDANWRLYVSAVRAVLAELRVLPDDIVLVAAANIAPWWSKGMAGSSDYGNSKKAAVSSLNGMVDAILEGPDLGACALGARQAGTRLYDVNGWPIFNGVGRNPDDCDFSDEYDRWFYRENESMSDPEACDTCWQDVSRRT